ncbi:MAG: type II secretion system major pseudopilin GspG [Pirellulales bacterium]|nr:type II secretion system major pseudopilin GspG [Pirellulales bacterium]
MRCSRRSLTLIRRRHKTHDAFTLVEVLLVLIILVIIGSIVVPNLFGVKDKADIDAAKAQVNALKSAMNMYRLDQNKYPASIKDLVEKPSDIAMAEKWRGPYLESAIKADPWGNEYQYLAQGKQNANGYDLWSNGPDGQNGSDDDIGNWEK